MFFGTVARVTAVSAQAVFDMPEDRMGRNGFSGAEITLWYCDSATDDYVPFDVGDEIQVVFRGTGPGRKRVVEKVTRNLNAGQVDSRKRQPQSL